MRVREREAEAEGERDRAIQRDIHTLYIYIERDIERDE